MSSEQDSFGLSPGATMVANRIRKNERRMAAWRKRENVQAWRAYDADIPEYAAAVDLYLATEVRWLVVQEYQPGKQLDPAVASERLRELVAGACAALAVDAAHCVVKTRQRQRGLSQYEKDDRARGSEREIREGAARLLVNLHDYLDTGLFLDHRPMRRFVHQAAAGGRFLNLFCYTASVSVQAALGGARDSLSIDLSNTYLDWAARNFRLNGLNTKQHQLKRADCMEWLAGQVQACHAVYDLIFLDPPSFSNSKRMAGVLDVQRDHELMVRQCMHLLAPGGLLIFSNNLRSFKLDEKLRQLFAVTDYHQQSLDPDFERNPKIHQCFLVRHG